MTTNLMQRAVVYASTINKDDKYNCYIDRINEDKSIVIKMRRNGLYMGTLKVLNDASPRNKKSIRKLATNLHNIMESDTYSTIHMTICL